MFLNVCSAAVCYGSALSRRGLGLSSSRETVCQFPAAPCRGPGASPLLPWAAVALRLHVLRGRLDGPRREEGADNAPGKRDVGRVHLAGLRARRSHPGSLAWQPASWTFSEPRRWAWGVAASKGGPLEKSRLSRAAFRTRGSVCARVSLRDLRILLRSPLRRDERGVWGAGKLPAPGFGPSAPSVRPRRPARRADRASAAHRLPLVRLPLLPSLASAFVAVATAPSWLSGGGTAACRRVWKPRPVRAGPDAGRPGPGLVLAPGLVLPPRPRLSRA